MTVVWALTWLGQSTAVAALTAAFVRLPACRANAAARYAAWAVALFLCAGLLAWQFVPSQQGAPSVPLTPAASRVQVAGAIPLVVLPVPPAPLVRWFGWIWGLGTAAGLALVVRDVMRVVRLKRRTAPLSAAEQGRLIACLSGQTSRRAPRLSWCDELDSPAVLGFASPVIALPRSQISHLTDEQAQLVLLHELAHVRRGDDWWALAERVVLALTWVNPAVHWVRRQLSLAREMACDEWVVRRTAAPVSYAKCLADVAGLRSQARRLKLASAITGRQGTLRRRIVGVLALDHRPHTRASGMIAWLAPVAVCVVAAGVLQLPPVFDVARPPDAGADEQAWALSVGTRGTVDAGAPIVRPSSARPPSPERRSLVSRRPSAETVAPGLTDEARGQAPLAQRAAIAQPEQTSEQPLAASPLPAAGAPGVEAPGAVRGTYSPESADARRWWDGPTQFGEATGGAATTAGRTTASFFKRVGSSVPRLFNR
jgi:beta-lactamase regulating signal transducer with metallopeptidase domain